MHRGMVSCRHKRLCSAVGKVAVEDNYASHPAVLLAGANVLFEPEFSSLKRDECVLFFVFFYV